MHQSRANVSGGLLGLFPGLLIAVAVFFSMITIHSQADESSLDLNAYVGKVVYVDFWASWCTPCRASFPFMQAMHNKYADDGLVVVGINVDAEYADAQRFLDSYPVDFAIKFDPEGTLAQQFSVSGMPNSYLYGRDGELLATHVGFTTGDAEPLERRIRKALTRAVSTRVGSTRATSRKGKSE